MTTRFGFITVQQMRSSGVLTVVTGASVLAPGASMLTAADLRVEDPDLGNMVVGRHLLTFSWPCASLTATSTCSAKGWSGLTVPRPTPSYPRGGPGGTGAGPLAMGTDMAVTVGTVVKVIVGTGLRTGAMARLGAASVTTSVATLSAGVGAGEDEDAFSYRP